MERNTCLFLMSHMFWKIFNFYLCLGRQWHKQQSWKIFNFKFNSELLNLKIQQSENTPVAHSGIILFILVHQWRVQDFPGWAPTRGGAILLFGQIFLKTAWKWRNFGAGEGARVPRTPPPPAVVQLSENTQVSHSGIILFILVHSEISNCH